MFQVEMRNRIASGLVTALIYVQLLAFGAMGGLPAAVFAWLQIVLCLGLIVLLAAHQLQPLWLELGPIMVLFFAALAWAAAPMLLDLPLSISPTPILAADAARLELLKLAGAGAACLTGAMLGFSRSRLQHFVLYMAAVGLVYAFIALWVGQASPFTVWGQPKGAHAFRFTGTFLNANAAGCLFGMIGLLALGQLQSLLKKTDIRAAKLGQLTLLAIVAGSVVAGFGACVLTQSRTALVLTGILGLAVVVAGAGRSGGGRVITISAGLMLLLSLGLGASQISSRWSSLEVDAHLRWSAYLRYLAAIARAPWFGYGLGGFKILHDSLLTPDLAAGLWDFGAAHSALTQAALEGGLPFLALLVGAISWMAARVLGLGFSRSHRGALIAAAIAAAVLAFACSFVDIALNVPSIAALTMTLWGLAWGDAVARRSVTATRTARNLTAAAPSGVDRMGA